MNAIWRLGSSARTVGQTTPGPAIFPEKLPGIRCGSSAKRRNEEGCQGWRKDSDFERDFAVQADLQSPYFFVKMPDSTRPMDPSGPDD